MSIRDPLHRYIIKRLVSAREIAQLTQISVARALGRPQSFVSKYESGERRLDIPEFIEVCRVMGVDPAQLIKEAMSAGIGETKEGA
jgi:transcriptional regulator with XRE-family HTH domain